MSQISPHRNVLSNSLNQGLISILLQFYQMSLAESMRVIASCEVLICMTKHKCSQGGQFSFLKLSS